MKIGIFVFNGPGNIILIVEKKPREIIFNLEYGSVRNAKNTALYDQMSDKK